MAVTVVVVVSGGGDERRARVVDDGTILTQALVAGSRTEGELENVRRRAVRVVCVFYFGPPRAAAVSRHSCSAVTAHG